MHIQLNESYFNEGRRRLSGYQPEMYTAQGELAVNWERAETRVFGAGQLLAYLALIARLFSTVNFGLSTCIFIRTKDRVIRLIDGSIILCNLSNR